MTTVFIAGSITIKRLDAKVAERIDNVIESGLDVAVGDADGADTAVQRYLAEKGMQRVTVYCTGAHPRNNLGGWPVHHVETKHAPGSRQFFTAKDIEMARSADYGLMVWDSKSTGTLNNVIELLARKKKSVVYVQKDKAFRTIGEPAHLEALVTDMTDQARQKADEKIHLSARVAALVQEQQRLFA
jgi:hypothetical protein